ncbi:Uu.00g088020.m01.CDS01 [Anthostomella pinea]|uniref:Uu.00g088020.m01.CDS01 n=1 Tax=Anthostomella pinea TaxID=933095 RepID=A0AAI8VND7_9PEZI|nr:Uu.00g088020.m01.CDS01 [Anthostomella pinea]
MRFTVAAVAFFLGVALATPAQVKDRSPMFHKDVDWSDVDDEIKDERDPDGTVVYDGKHIISYKADGKELAKIDVKDGPKVDKFKRASAAAALVDGLPTLDKRSGCGGECIANNNCTDAACPNCGLNGQPNPYVYPSMYCW